MKKSKRILLTGSGAPGWVPIFKCLIAGDASFEIYGSDIKAQTAGSYYAKGHITLPAGDDPSYIETVLVAAKKAKIDTIIPLTDAELLPLANNLDLFSKEGIKIPISSPSALEIATNKMKLFTFLTQEHLGQCEYYLANSLEAFQTAIKKLGFPNKAVCFKPSIAWGSRGFRIIDPNVDQYTLLMKEKPNSTFITYDQILAILQTAKPFPELLVMEYLPGEEYTVDILIHKGEIKYIVPRLRLKMTNGITTEGIVVQNNDIIDLSKKIVAKLHLDYAVGIQFKYDAQKVPKVLEINPRLQGTTVISHGAGVNIPYYTLLALEGKQIPKRKIRYGTHMFRHWEEVFFRK